MILSFIRPIRVKEVIEMSLAVASPFRLQDLGRKCFPNAIFPSNNNTRSENRKIMEKADIIAVILDDKSKDPTKSVGTKVELQYAINSHKLKYIVFIGEIGLSDLDRILNGLPSYDEYVHGEM
jgi:nucleoside 2-deoxyribosyltransferase